MLCREVRLRKLRARLNGVAGRQVKRPSVVKTSVIMSPRAQRQSPQKKTVPKQGMLATLGVNAVERIVTNMGFVWRPRTILDVGLDGDIEIRDPQSGAMTGAFIGVQVKASEYGGQLGANDEFSYVNAPRVGPVRPRRNRAN